MKFVALFAVPCLVALAGVAYVLGGELVLAVRSGELDELPRRLGRRRGILMALGVGAAFLLLCTIFAFVLATIAD